MNELPEQYTLTIVKESDIKAPADVTFAAILEEIGPAFTQPDGKSLNMKLEAWPGGRWYRDLGNGAGHFWGHVQVIKPGKLLELSGPLFMSYPVLSHVQYQLSETNGVTNLKFTHRAFGLLDPEHKKHVNGGWEMITAAIIKRATR